MINVLELFAGSRSIGKVADLLEMNVLSVDKFIKKDIDLVCGVEDITEEQIRDLLGTPDVIWASPVCNAWSKTGWFSYWDTKAYKAFGQFVPKKDFAVESVEMVHKTIEIFSWFPNAVFFMENPEGMLQKHPVLNTFYDLGIHENLKRRKVTYCSYGSLVRKPTHIWTNSPTWIPRPHCNEGDDCHLRTPKNSQKGVRALKDSYDRSKVPAQLCFEILKQFSTDYELEKPKQKIYSLF